jgi:hypothetical protein
MSAASVGGIRIEPAFDDPMDLTGHGFIKSSSAVHTRFANRRAGRLLDVP